MRHHAPVTVRDEQAGRVLQASAQGIHPEHRVVGRFVLSPYTLRMCSTLRIGLGLEDDLPPPCTGTVGAPFSLTAQLLLPFGASSACHALQLHAAAATMQGPSSPTTAHQQIHHGDQPESDPQKRHRPAQDVDHQLWMREGSRSRLVSQRVHEVVVQVRDEVLTAPRSQFQPGAP